MDFWLHVRAPSLFTPLLHASRTSLTFNIIIQDRNLLYVVQVELYLSQVLFPSPSDDKDDLLYAPKHVDGPACADFCRNPSSMFDGTAPPHFYGELTRTEEGCQVLREKGHFADFAQFVRRHGLEDRDLDIVNKLKSVLWAVVSR